MIVAVEVRVLHQIQLVDRIDLLARDRGRCAADAVVVMVMVLVVLHVRVMAGAVGHGQV